MEAVVKVTYISTHIAECPFKTFDYLEFSLEFLCLALG